MKTAGIVGGIAPESTIQYYRLMISIYRERKGDGSYPSILIDSIDMKTMLDLIGGGDLLGCDEIPGGRSRAVGAGGSGLCLAGFQYAAHRI